MQLYENFWSLDERMYFRQAMESSQWFALSDMPYVQSQFPGCGNWSEGIIAPDEFEYLRDRLDPIVDIEPYTFALNYFSYGVGDSLISHDDSDNVAGDSGTDFVQYREVRHTAIISYVHEQWESNWGGELVIDGEYIVPRPGLLITFRVPQEHRIARVKPQAGKNRRLSITGWIVSTKKP